MTLGSLVGRLTGRLTVLDGSLLALLPARRTIEASCTDLDVIYHAYWRRGKLSDLHVGPAERPDIRIRLASDDLFRLADGTLDVRTAYATRRVRIDAALGDLLRLRAVL